MLKLNKIIIRLPGYGLLPDQILLQKYCSIWVCLFLYFNAITSAWSKVFSPSQKTTFFSNFIFIIQITLPDQLFKISFVSHIQIKLNRQIKTQSSEL